MDAVLFQKPALSLSQQVELLKNRGLTIDDDVSAARYLKHVGYYRLSGYMLPFQEGGHGPNRHRFKAGSHLEKIIDLYVFDRKLRLLFLDAIEYIEVALRSAISAVMAVRHGPHWFLRPEHFEKRTFNHENFLNRAREEIGHNDHRRRHVFIEHYYRRYSEPEMPPSWMLFEALPFGMVSMVLKRLHIGNRKAIAAEFNLPEPAMQSWPHCLSYARNLCAHHSRLWNRRFTIKPWIARQFQADLQRNDRLYAQLVVTQIFMRTISPDSRWPEKVSALLEDHPEITLARLGFPADWRSRPVWR